MLDDLQAVLLHQGVGCALDFCASMILGDQWALLDQSVDCALDRCASTVLSDQ